jgi:hypothetical protein
MNAMMRFCPGCEGERPLDEMFCGNCGWNLAEAPIRPSGWRPTPVVTAQHEPPAALVCVNGHPMEAGDLICPQCGADLAPSPEAATAPTAGALDTPGTLGASGETVIDGWRVLRQISNTVGLRDRYLAEEVAAGRRQAVLTLYHQGAEPDPSVYEALKRVSRAHVPDIYATGRWDGRAYEAAEALTGETLADLGFAVLDAGAVQNVVQELGMALNALAEVGLRHRDLRPGALLARQRDPLDLVIGGFGSARLSEFDLDIVSPLEITRYTAPEALAGGVAAASDWWSLGMVLLEQITQGACFAGVNQQAFLIHVLANGAPIPDGLDARTELLLRGLLVRDRMRRWGWNEVKAWREGKAVLAPPRAGGEAQGTLGAGVAITLSGKPYHDVRAYALSAAKAEHWEEARGHLARGALVSWAQDTGADAALLAGLRRVAAIIDLEEDFRLLVALKVLNPDMPPIHQGAIVTPRWLLMHPVEGYRLMTGRVPDLLGELGMESWLGQLKSRGVAVRSRAQNLGVALEEETLRIHLLGASSAKLAAEWEARRGLLPDTEHPGLLNLLEKQSLCEVDLIVVLSASIGQFRSRDLIVEEASALAARYKIPAFNAAQAEDWLRQPRSRILQAVDERIEGFARCANETVNGWANEFRLDRRMPLPQALALLAIPAEAWQKPQNQEYVAQILDFFARKVAGGVTRGPLARMSVGRASTRIDLAELETPRLEAAALLDRLLLRDGRPVTLDPAAFEASEGVLERRLRNLESHTRLYWRDTGIDGGYLGFPFLRLREAGAGKRVAPRMIPVLLWPMKIRIELGAQGKATVAFDSEREEVRLNPALEILLGVEAAARWHEAANELLGRSALRAVDVMDALGALATPRTRTLSRFPDAGALAAGQGRGQNKGQDAGQGREPSLELECAAVLFHVTFAGQAVGEDVRQLKALPVAATGLETVLRLGARSAEDPAPLEWDSETDRYFTASSDPSQEEAVLRARRSPGLVVEGPPGTGKSQTIVNMVCDAIGRGQTLLIVCQKHAALEVVYKRLAAEGFSHRVLMINDVNRDRSPIIRAVREQLERLWEPGAAAAAAAVRRERQDLAARIESLEKTLDDHHAVLHRVDERIGTSYRDLLGDLIRLESPAAPLDVPALRARLAPMNLAALALLEEEIAPLIRYWLPARHEGSPLYPLAVFADDSATLADFTQAFQAFCRAEAARAAALARPVAFDLDDPAPHRAWLAAHAQALLDLPEEERALLARWLPWFRPAPGETITGDAMMAELQRLLDALATCRFPDYDATMSPALGRLPDKELARLERGVREALNTAGFWAGVWARLNPMRHMRGRRMLAFLRGVGVVDAAGVNATTTNARLEALLAGIVLERNLRPLRRTLNELHGRLRLPPLPEGAGEKTRDEARATLRSLRQVADWAERLAHAPWPEKLIQTAQTGMQEDWARCLAEYDVAFVRCAARATSGAALAGLQDWMEKDWLAAAARLIECNEPPFPNLQSMEAAFPSLAAYQRFRGRAGKLSASAVEILGLLRMKEAELDRLAPQRLEAETRRILNREARLGWKQSLEQSNPELSLEREDLAAKVAQLAELDQKMRAQNRRLLCERYDLAAIEPLREWEDITRLTGPRARRLREFLRLGEGLGLMKLCPVWLMNPDVASRVLPLKAALFDAVICDEASQMPVEFALPALFRARNVIVSGDEKQMPPTAFFSSRVESEEAQVFDGALLEEDAPEEEQARFEENWNRREIKDCPDLLQLARVCLPNTRLRIHYRSAYRELIDYSNAVFYGNDLNVPVRHSDSMIAAAKPIEVIRVDGLYEEQCNPAEAERVIALLAKIWRAPYDERPSVGVVTFNRKQAEEIEEALERRAETDEAFRAAYRQESQRSEGGEDMAVFVKNVENVQGDERDVIIFSSTFGRNRQGTFRRNFGVLGQRGGERRLNVAVTRARRKIFLVTSMPIRDLSDLLATQGRPTKPRDFLQGYMEYARCLSEGDFVAAKAWLARWAASGAVAGQASVAPEEDRFRTLVGTYVRALGYRVVPASGSDVFGLDFAIEHPATGAFAIGIECDAPRHELLTRARAREIWRPTVLRRAIPVIHRVSSLAWRETGEAERLRLRLAIEDAMLKENERAIS